MSRLKDLYNDEITEAMIKKFGYKNIMEVPKLDKIVINMGSGEFATNSKLLEKIQNCLKKMIYLRKLIMKFLQDMDGHRIDMIKVVCHDNEGGEKDEKKE